MHTRSKRRQAVPSWHWVGSAEGLLHPHSGHVLVQSLPGNGLWSLACFSSRALGTSSVLLQPEAGCTPTGAAGQCMKAGKIPQGNRPSAVCFAAHATILISKPLCCLFSSEVEQRANELEAAPESRECINLANCMVCLLS